MRGRHVPGGREARGGIEKDTDSTMHDALIESALRLGHRDVSHSLLHDPAIAYRMGGEGQPGFVRRADHRVDMRLLKVP